MTVRLGRECEIVLPRQTQDHQEDKSVVLTVVCGDGKMLVGESLFWRTYNVASAGGNGCTGNYNESNSKFCYCCSHVMFEDEGTCASVRPRREQLYMYMYSYRVRYR